MQRRQRGYPLPTQPGRIPVWDAYPIALVLRTLRAGTRAMLR